MLCKHCNKLIYDTQRSAMRAVNGIKRRANGSNGRAYRCPFGNWHITRMVHEVKPVFRTKRFYQEREREL